MLDCATRSCFFVILCTQYNSIYMQIPAVLFVHLKWREKANLILPNVFAFINNAHQTAHTRRTKTEMCTVKPNVISIPYKHKIWFKFRWRKGNIRHWELLLSFMPFSWFYTPLCNTRQLYIDTSTALSLWSLRANIILHSFRACLSRRLMDSSLKSFRTNRIDFLDQNL